MLRLPVAAVRTFAIAGVALATLAFGSRMRADHIARQKLQTENFDIGFHKPKGFEELWHGPQALFVYLDPTTGLFYRGSVNQVVADFNPTPTMNSDALAAQMVSNTRANMPGWKGVVLDSVTTSAVDWRLVRREGGGKCVVSAFGVRGNTTAMVSLVGVGKNIPRIDAEMDSFRAFLRTITFDKADLSKRFIE